MSRIPWLNIFYGWVGLVGRRKQFQEVSRAGQVAGKNLSGKLCVENIFKNRINQNVSIHCCMKRDELTKNHNNSDISSLGPEYSKLLRFC